MAISAHDLSTHDGATPAAAQAGGAPGADDGLELVEEELLVEEISIDGMCGVY